MFSTIFLVPCVCVVFFGQPFPSTGPPLPSTPVPPLDRPKFRLFLFASPASFLLSFFVSREGLLVELWPRVVAMDQPNCANWPQRSLGVPWPRPVATIPREDPQREIERKKKWSGRGEKKKLIFGPPTRPGPTLYDPAGRPHLSDPCPSKQGHTKKRKNNISPPPKKKEQYIGQPIN